MNRSIRMLPYAVPFVGWLGAPGLTACTSPATHRPPPAQAPERSGEGSDELVERGRAFARAGDLTRAAQYLTAALAQGADDRAVIPLLLEVYVRSRRYRVALDRAESYLGRHPDDVAVRFLVGSLHLALGDDGPAAAHFEQVVACRPEHASAHFALAVLLRDGRGDLERADVHFRRYLELEPRGPHAAAARASARPGAPLADVTSGADGDP